MSNLSPSARDDSVGVTNTASAGGTRTQTQALPESYGTNGQAETNNLQPNYRPNPLGFFSSYTYNITLYLATPRAINNYFSAFEAGRRFVFDPAQFFIVAQSGGVDNSSENRALTLDGILGKGEGYDYYIEDLQINQVMPTRNGSQVPTDDTEITFKIIEPTGFSLVNQLVEATEQVTSVNPELYSGVCNNAYQQFYMIGIRFYGYDENGKVYQSDQIAAGDLTSAVTNKNALYERFFPIQIKTFKFKLDGRATIYSIEAAPITTATVLGEARNTTNQIYSLNNGTTVAAALNELMNAMNLDQKNQVKAGNRLFPHRYKVEFSPDCIETIARARLTDDNTAGLQSFSRNILNTTQVNVAAAVRAATINTTSRTITFGSGQAITQAITDVITGSTYITDAINKINSSNPQPVSSDNPTSKIFNWFTITPKIEIRGYDGKITNDWVYSITYLVQPYSVAFATSNYIDRTKQFYGVQKRYNYWYTGLNTEILSLEFTYDNAYYEVLRNSQNRSPIIQNKSDGRKRDVKNSNGGSPTIGGKLEAGGYNQDVGASIMSDADNTQLTFRIIGDPDFLMTTTSVPYIPLTNTSYIYGNGVGSVYGPGMMLNPMRGQIFAEIVFAAASDYSDETGLLEIHRPVKLYTDRGTGIIKQVYGIEGHLYQINRVVSNFTRGQFTQQLECVVVSEIELLKKIASEGSDRSGVAELGIEERRGFTEDTTTTAQYCTPVTRGVNQQPPPQQNTTASGVANDDGSARNEAFVESRARASEELRNNRTASESNRDLGTVTETDGYVGTFVGGP